MLTSNRSSCSAAFTRLVALVIMTMIISALTLVSASPATAQQVTPEPRWFQIDGDVLRTDPSHIDNQPDFLASYLDLVRSAATLGYNGIVIRGNEINVLGPDGDGEDSGWVTAIKAVTSEARANGLDVIMSYGSIGRCSRLLLENNKADYATAYPVTMEMDLNGGVLGAANEPTLNQTLAGESITGNGSVLAVVSDLEIGGHYRVSVELAGDLDIGKIRVRAVNAINNQNPAESQILNALELAPASQRTDNTVVMAFNSFRSETVRIFVEASGRASAPTAQVDVVSYSVEAVPVLNGVNRGGMIGDQDALAVDIISNGTIVDTFTLGDGLSLRDEDGVRVHRDPELGAWDHTVNSWSARHNPPELRINTRWLPAQWDTLELRGWHALPFKKVVSCSWNDPAVHSLISRVSRHAHRLGATGHLLPFDEINTGGAEPADGFGTNAAAAMSDSIAGVVGAVRNVIGTTRPIYIFSDMIDENTNAHPCYEHVVGSLAGPSPVPSGVTVLTWDESGPGDQHFIRDLDECFAKKPPNGFSVSVHREAGLENIAGLSATQILAAYYDTDDVAEDRTDWIDAIDESGVSNVSGVIYAAWTPPTACPGYAHGNGPYDCQLNSANACKFNLENNGCVYEHLAEFAGLWWGGVDDPNPTCKGRTPTLIGTPDDDELFGTADRDVIWAGAGNDTIYGLGGDDIICTGIGDDLVYAGDGNDRVFTEGTNRAFGGPGNDVLVGGPNPDNLWGGPGSDRLTGGQGDDVLAGGPGDDDLFGGPGHDLLNGGDGSDGLQGGPGSSDVCDGDAGVDTHIGQCESLIEIP